MFYRYHYSCFHILIFIGVPDAPCTTTAYADDFSNVTNITNGTFPVYLCRPKTVNQGPTALIPPIAGPYLYFNPADFLGFQCFSTPKFNISNGVEISFDAAINGTSSKVYFGVRLNAATPSSSSLYYIVSYMQWFSQGPAGWMHFTASVPPIANGNAQLVFDYDGSARTLLAIDNLVIKERKNVCSSTTSTSITTGFITTGTSSTSGATSSTTSSSTIGTSSTTGSGQIVIPPIYANLSSPANITVPGLPDTVVISLPAIPGATAQLQYATQGVPGYSDPAQATGLFLLQNTSFFITITLNGSVIKIFLEKY